MDGRFEVTFYDDPARFLERAGAVLEADPVTSTVISTIAARMARADGAGFVAAPYSWFAVVAGADGEVAGVAMRTAPFPPYPLFLLSMPDDAARALAHALVDRGEEVGGANGALPATEEFATTVAERTGRRVEVDMHSRLFEFADLVEPRPAVGRLRPAAPDEAALVLEWYHRFHVDADEQAGRPPTRMERGAGTTLADVVTRIRDGRVWFWVDETDSPVHVTGANPPAYGVVRIGPVFTPKEQRGRGYASAAVAEVSRLLRDDGIQVILFTDQANPTSNRIYVALGYRPVVDMVELAIT